jgi:serine phosphatase RsbU (regulator of sigma subunit)
VAGIDVPGTGSIKVPHVPVVSLQTPGGTPAPVANAVNAVNGVTNGASGTVNGVVDSVNGTAGNAGDVIGGATGGGNPVTGNPVTGSTAPSSRGATAPSTGSGSSPAPQGGSSGGGSSASPTSGGGSAQSGRGRQARRPFARSGGSRSASARRATRRAAARRRARTTAAARKPGAAAAATRTRAVKTSSSSGHKNPVVRAFDSIQQVIPGPVKALIAVLAVLAAGFAVRSRMVGARARRLERQRQELLGDVGLLQRALLPDVPASLRGIEASVAYRPAEGPAAGGDFYDVFELDGGRVAVIVGDVCGHGRAALAVTALMRYTLRAYLGAGFEPRVALQVAARALDGEPDGALTTVVLALYDPAAGTLTYAAAGHEQPIVLGASEHEPVTACSAPPLGGFMPSGQRQTTIALPPGSAACFFTDGLVEARLGDSMMGRDRLTELLTQLEPDAGAQLLLDRIAQSVDRAPDDMAACLLRTRADAVAAPPVRIEELEVEPAELRGDRVAEFLAACGIAGSTVDESLRAAQLKASEFGGVVIRVVMEADGSRVEVSPRRTAALPVPSLEGARGLAALEASV